ncbi:hypothetical protein D9757_009244 [Collybiopsis confluens]|uniref:DUF6598 domain-containing protein n=1 Tax=Collybiopsis confluens TaxID=2823264 RepID=A0A8H5M356_9AGAR|nr:hypothetical protein D9757_009244 [Collybiopsis confluens]
MAPPALPKGFNFDKDGVEKFLTFIAQIRAGLAHTKLVIEEDGVTHVIPILAPQAREGQGLLTTFDLNLTAHGQTTIVRLRRDNLYIIGYRGAGRAGVWHELLHWTGQRLIPDSTAESLPFQGNYIDLVKSGAASLALQSVPLSVKRIQEAVRALAADNQKDMQGIARGILTLAIVIAEASRFTSIATLVRRSWRSEAEPGPEIAELIRGWGRSSNAVQRYPTIREFVLPGITLIPNLAAAVVMLGIVPLDASGPVPEPSQPKHAVLPKGQPLLELFSVHIDDPCDLYGTIKVTDDAGTVVIWNHNTDNAVKTKSNDDIVLEGPIYRPLYAADAFTIDIDLADSKDPLSNDSDAIAKGTITFDPFDYFTKYDVVNNIPVTATDGKVTVSYVALSNALYAEITVILIKGGGESNPEVYGDITAFNGHGTSSLYHKTNKQYSNVNVNSPITLSRTLVAVPVNGTLRINATLWDRDPIFDDKIAEGSAVFVPLYKQPPAKKTITGDSDGEIEVQVTWL